MRLSPLVWKTQYFNKSDFRIDPGKKTRIVDFPSGQTEEFLDYLFACCLKETAVHIKAYIQDLSSDSFVFIYERMTNPKDNLAILSMPVGSGFLESKVWSCVFIAESSIPSPGFHHFLEIVFQL